LIHQTTEKGRGLPFQEDVAETLVREGVPSRSLFFLVLFVMDLSFSLFGLFRLRDSQAD
jgi:hypothetical protein